MRFINKLHTPWRLYFAAAFLSFLLSVLALINNNPVELDSLLYIKAAEVFGQQGIAAAMQIYSWPLFSILLAKLHQYLHLPLIDAGYGINAVFQAMIVIFFIRLIKQLKGNTHTLFFAAITILFYPYLNKIRPYITRDFGYWAFSLWGLLALLRYQNAPAWKECLVWNGCMIIATLFRIEGAIFILFGPLILVLTNPKKNFMATLKLYLPYLLLIPIGIWQVNHSCSTAKALGRLPEIIYYFQHSLETILAQINTKSHIVGKSILTNISFNDSNWFLFGGLVSLFLAVFIRTLNPVYIYLSSYSFCQSCFPSTRANIQLIIYFVLLNLGVLALFLAQNFFMVDRYLVMLDLLLMLGIPFGLEKLYAQRKQKAWKFNTLLLIFILFATGGIIRFGYSKAYITEAGKWIKENTPSTSKLYSNSPQLLFYAQRQNPQGQVYYLNPPTIDRLNATVLKQYNYIAMWQTKTEGANIFALYPKEKLILLKTFQNKRGDKISIFNAIP